jgi:hypothetical protein
MNSPMRQEETKKLEKFKNCLTEEIKKINNNKLNRYGINDLQKLSKIKILEKKFEKDNDSSGKFKYLKSHDTLNEKNVFRDRLRKILEFSL